MPIVDEHGGGCCGIIHLHEFDTCKHSRSEICVFAISHEVRFEHGVKLCRA
jgi:hypothetical protein